MLWELNYYQYYLLVLTTVLTTTVESRVCVSRYKYVEVRNFYNRCHVFRLKIHLVQTTYLVQLLESRVSREINTRGEHAVVLQVRTFYKKYFDRLLISSCSL